jgi:hypothetical protein
MVEGAGSSGYTLPRRGGRVVECGGLENRYVGNPGVGGSNPPLSAGHGAPRLVSTLPTVAFSTPPGGGLSANAFVKPPADTCEPNSHRALSSR